MAERNQILEFKEWIETVPQAIKEDMLWKVQVYRMALYASDLAWNDVTVLLKDKRTVELSGQLYRAIGSVSANIAEGYGRVSAKDRTRFYQYALGSARETRDSYFKARHMLGDNRANQCIDLMARCIKPLIVMVNDTQNYVLREEPNEYGNELSIEELEY